MLPQAFIESQNDLELSYKKTTKEKERHKDGISPASWPPLLSETNVAPSEDWSWWSTKQKNRHPTVEIKKKKLSRSLSSSQDNAKTWFRIDWEGIVEYRWACRTQRLGMLFGRFSTWFELESHSMFPLYTHDRLWEKAHHLRWDANGVETVQSFNISDNGSCKSALPSHYKVGPPCKRMVSFTVPTTTYRTQWRPLNLCKTKTRSKTLSRMESPPKARKILPSQSPAPNHRW